MILTSPTPSPGSGTIPAMRTLGLAVLLALALTAPASGTPWLAVTSDGGSSTVSAVDLTANAAAGGPIAAGGPVQRIAIAPDARTAYVGIAGACGGAGGAVQAI